MNNNDAFKNIGEVVIYGAGGHAISVANVVLSMGYRIKYFVDEENVRGNIMGYKVINEIKAIDLTEDSNMVLAIGDNSAREKTYEKITKIYNGIRFPSLIHSSAIISEFSEMGEGTVVMPGAVVGANVKIGKFCIVNTSASLDHDSVMLDFSSLAPAAVTGGSVKLGRRAVASIGSIIKQRITVGDDSILGAASYLHHDLPNNVIAYGIPAKIIKNRMACDPYL